MKTEQMQERQKNATVQIPRDTWVKAKHRTADLEIPIGKYLDQLILKDIEKHPR